MSCYVGDLIMAKIEVFEWHAEIKLSDTEVKELCKPGDGANTCSWLVAGTDGFKCCCLHKPHALLDRHEKKEMTALRDGCDEVKGLNMIQLGMGLHEIDLLDI